MSAPGNDQDATILAAWRVRVPDATPEEVAALLPIVQSGDGPLRRLIRAYRAGVAAATPKPDPDADPDVCSGCGATWTNTGPVML